MYGVFYRRKDNGQEKRSCDFPAAYLTREDAERAFAEYAPTGAKYRGDDYYARELPQAVLSAQLVDADVVITRNGWKVIKSRYQKAVERSEKKKKKKLTDEERIRQIQLNVEAGLYVPVTEVKLLLDKYIGLLAENLARDLVVASIGLGVEPTAHKAVEELETLPPNS